jgi:hypothetical protein
MDLKETVMKIELVPVIEIFSNRHKVKSSAMFPYWKYPAVWDKFHAAVYANAGFPDKMYPYAPGSALFRFRDISQANLTRLVKNYLERLLSFELSRGNFTPFFGGYILKVNNKNVLYPQCCGNLSDIHYWEVLLHKPEEASWEAHPVPVAKEDAGAVVLRCSSKTEDFIPPAPGMLRLDKAELRLAIDRARRQLHEFCGRLQEINVKERLHLSGIDRLLVWGEAEDNFNGVVPGSFPRADMGTVQNYLGSS